MFCKWFFTSFIRIMLLSIITAATSLLAMEPPRKRARTDAYIPHVTFNPLFAVQKYIGQNPMLTMADLIRKTERVSAKTISIYRDDAHQKLRTISSLMPTQKDFLSVLNPEFSVYKLDVNKHHPYLFAAALGNVQLMDILCSSLIAYHGSIMPNCLINPYEGFSAAHYAVFYNQPEMLKTIIRTIDYQLDYMDGQSHKPLDLAVALDNIECVKVLLAYDASITIRIGEGYTPFAIAKRKNNPDMISIFNDYIAQHPEIKNPSISGNTQNDQDLFNAANANDTEAVLRILEENPTVNINIQNHRFTTPLMCAVKNRNLPMIRALLRKPNININAQNNKNETALMWATFTNEHGELPPLEIAQELLKMETININTKNRQGATTLMAATITQNLSLVQEFLKNETLDINSQENNGINALMFSIAGRNQEIFQAVLSHKAINANAHDIEGGTPLMNAAREENPFFIRALLDKQEVSVNADRLDGNTALHMAIEDGNLAHVQTLISRQNINVNIPNNDGITPLMLAIVHETNPNGLAIFRALLEHPGRNINLIDNLGRPTFLFAILKGTRELNELLLDQQDIDLNIQGPNGNNILMYAMCRKDNSLFQVILDKEGVDINARDSDGLTVLMYAVHSNNPFFVNALLEKEIININTSREDGRTALSIALEEHQAYSEEIDKQKKAEIIELLEQAKRKKCRCLK